MIRVAVLAVWVLLAGCEPASNESQASEPASEALPHADVRPNILLIVADDLGFTDLGAFGGEIGTPHLDELAREGLRLTNLHAAASCAPTRAMLVTGTDHHLVGMATQSGLATDQQAEHRNYRAQLFPEVPTVMEVMRDAGYATFMAGKWHLGYDQESLPGARGFERSVALLEGGAGHFDDAKLLARYERTHWIEDDADIELPADFYSTDFLTDRLLTYLREDESGRPFFAWLAYTAPHWPLQAPAEDINRYRGRYAEGWDALRQARLEGAIREGVIPADYESVPLEPGMGPWSEVSDDDRPYAEARMEVYAAMVNRMDAQIGRVLEQLRADGRLENTIVVFMSDNGGEAHAMDSEAVHGDWLRENFNNELENIGAGDSYVALQAGWARATIAAFRDSKSKQADGGTRVPGFVWWNGFDRPGAVDPSLMRAMDLGPTFIEFAGAQAPESMMGRSLAARWRGGGPAYRQDEIVASELYGRRAVRRGHWKAILQEPPHGPGNWQLYNLQVDPGEQNDLAAHEPALLAELVLGWEAYASDVGVVNPEHGIRY